tara:strand:- start:96181 stop:96639 length:459 start_codon:yes stop_codon:yes gene_type:complete
MRIATSTVLTLLALTLVGCKSTSGDGASPQSIVEATAAKNDGCTRLTLHCVQEDGSTKVCASTATERVGTASDPEDLRAMKSGEVVVMDEGAAVDVTVPIVQTDGKWTTVCGVTLERGDQTKEMTVERAKAIAKVVQASLADCCPNGTCCSK